MNAAIRNTSKASEASPRNTSSRTTSTTPSRSTSKTKPRSKLRVAPITIHAGLQYSDSPLVKMHVCTYIQNYAWLVEGRGVTNEDAIAKLQAELDAAKAAGNKAKVAELEESLSARKAWLTALGG